MLDVTTPEALPTTEQKACEHCNAAFRPRVGSGGKEQRFCSEDCRREWNAAHRQRAANAPTRNQSDDASDTPEPMTHQRRAMLDRAEFDWLDDSNVVLREQPETAVYFRPDGALVIRQRAAWNEQDDPFVWISANNVFDFIDRLCDMAGIPSAGGPGR